MKNDFSTVLLLRLQTDRFFLPIKKNNNIYFEIQAKNLDIALFCISVTISIYCQNI